MAWHLAKLLLLESLTLLVLKALGVGGVGAAFLEQLATVLPDYPDVHVSLIARSTKSLVAPHPLEPLSLRSWAKDLNSSWTASPPAVEIIDFLKSAPGHAVLVDNTSDQHLAGRYADFLTRGISVVTPNKKAFSGPQFLWDSIHAATRGPSGALVYHESTVGAGLPVLSTLRDLVLTGDRVKCIEGVFSGTMSFLFNQFMPGAGAPGAEAPKWSAIVAQAKERGYTEPDPREDLNGLDVARKLVILARAAGAKVESTSAFPVKSLIPGPLESVGSADEFLGRLSEFDGEMETLRANAEKEGKVLRYCARMVRSEGQEGAELEVKVDGVAKGSPLANLEGADNLFCFYTKRYGDTPLIIRGAG